MLLLIIVTAYGFIAGWLSGTITDGIGLGTAASVVVGIIGSFAGLFLSFIAVIFVGMDGWAVLLPKLLPAVGAIVLLIIVNLIKR